MSHVAEFAQHLVEQHGPQALPTITAKFLSLGNILPGEDFEARCGAAKEEIIQANVLEENENHLWQVKPPLPVADVEPDA